MHLTRRGFVSLVGKAAAVGGGAALVAACAQPAQPTPTPAPAAKPAEPAPTPKPVTAPTPTPIPMLTPVPQPAGTTKLLLRVHWSGGRLNDFQEIISKYNTTQGPMDKIYIALERFVAGTAGPIATFIADFQAGTQEDIYHLNDAYLADLADRGFFVPPPKEIQDYIKEHYLASAVKTGTWKGQVMGHPTENQPHMFFCNKKLFQEAGLDATKDAPKTYDDIRRLAKQLTKVEGGQKVQAGYIVHDNSGERVMIQRVLYQFLEGEPLVDDTVTPPKFNVTSDGARKFTDLLYNMTKDGSTSAGMGPNAVIWQQRKGAMMTHDAWAVIFVLLKEGVPGIMDEQYTLGLHSSDGKKTGNLSRNYHFLVSSKTKYPDLCWTFLKWMNHGPEYRMQDFQTNTFGFVASVKNYPLPKEFPEQMKQAFGASLKEPNQTAMPVIKGLAEVYNILRDHHDALILGKQNADEYTKKVDAELKEAMKKAYAS